MFETDFKLLCGITMHTIYTCKHDTGLHDFVFRHKTYITEYTVYIDYNKIRGYKMMCSKTLHIQHIMLPNEINIPRSCCILSGIHSITI